MKKLELKKFQSKNSPNFVMIPGGPGLGPISFLNLTESFSKGNVYWYDPTFEEDKYDLDAQITKLTNELVDLDNLILIGHSFGGLLSLELTKANLDLRHVFCICTPISKQSFLLASKEFSKKQNSSKIEAQKKYSQNPNNCSFKEMFLSNCDIYFSPEFTSAGYHIFESENYQYKLFKESRAQIETREEILENINTNITTFISSSDDQLFPGDHLNLFYNDLGFNSFSIKSKSHFLHTEEPNQVLKLIFDNYNRGDK